MEPGITLRDLVHAIPLYAIKQGLLTVEKKGKKCQMRQLNVQLTHLTAQTPARLSDPAALQSQGCGQVC
jgi:aconitase B